MKMLQKGMHNPLFCNSLSIADDQEDKYSNDESDDVDFKEDNFNQTFTLESSL